MKVQYFIDEQIDENVGKQTYVPVSMKLYRSGQPGFKKGYPWHMIDSPEPLELRVQENHPTYIVIFIEHSGKDEATRYFFSEKDARKYIWALERVISQQQKVTDVDVHYDSGKNNLSNLLKEIPVNTYTSFRTPTDTFSITLGRV